MTTLTGTPKQIAWAEDIRRDLIGRYNALIDKFTAAVQRKPGQDAAFAVVKPAMDARLAEVLATADAKWWIDNQYRVLDDIKKAGSVAGHQAGF